jgi:Helicase conserved C-terminal domain
MSTSTEIRTQLVEALRLDLVGPSNDHAFAHELLPQSPRRWYLTGFLVPSSAERKVKSSGDAEMEEAADEKLNGADDTETSEPAARVSYLPSSMGLSVLLKPQTHQIEAVIRWGDYHWEAEEKTPEPDEEEAARKYEEEAAKHVPPPEGVEGETLVLREEPPGKKPRPREGYRRDCREETVLIPITSDGGKPRTFPIPNERRLNLVASIRPLHGLADAIPEGAHAVSVFLVNDREGKGRETYRALVFQTEIELRCAEGFLGRPDLRGLAETGAPEIDESVAALHYRDVLEYAVGHGVSAEPVVVVGEVCQAVRTCWIPSAEVERVDHFNPPGLNLDMEALGSLTDHADAVAKLGPLVSAYRDWIAAQEASLDGLHLPATQRMTAEDLIRGAKVAADRIADGLARLDGPEALDAFKIANRAMARAARRRRPDDAPQWRAFQLAFVLMNLTGLADPAHPEREIVDLLFFPTGGGKTEAYLGLAAFTLVLRRLRNQGAASAGVSILMRYTLRLLTLDQLGRAATLMCALELERAQDPRLGTWPFEIGLWVGSAATPNRMGKAGDTSAGADKTAYSRTTKFKGKSNKYSAPIPIESCPWCGEKFNADCWELHPIGSPQPSDLRVSCAKESCEFSSARNMTLPIVGVDEPIYRRLPCFLIATVDKFAALPWTGRVGCLFGHVQRHDSDGFYGPCDPNKGQPIPGGALLPPDLIVQDELHLISGPLGTIAGIYEVAIEQLCCRPLPGGGVRRPKIIASTATVRRADRQIRALFGRAQTAIFPPPGPSRMDSFFARTTPATPETPGRLYLGVAAQGRSMKVVLLRVARALLAGAGRLYHDHGGRVPGNPADPYMTLLGYFNSLRELGGSRRIAEDEIKTQLELYWRRRRLEPEDRLFAARYIRHSPLELTSRVDTDEVAAAKQRLAADFASEERVDVALATNMISVGLDILRLGLMVVFGQPKTSSEYIQATSRVGRQKDKPGLVVTLLNIHRPRDRSHYERFNVYHRTFYRSVEATSVTPFSPRALDRALAAAVVGLCRHSLGKLTPGAGAMAAQTHFTELQELVKIFGQRARTHDLEIANNEKGADLESHVINRAHALLAAWGRLIHDRVAQGAGALPYQRFEDRVSDSALLRDFLDPTLTSASDDERRFCANRSMRDVEAAVDIQQEPSAIGTNS